MAKKAENNHRKLCRQFPKVVRNFDPSVSAHRASFILAGAAKWVNGTEITYMFVEKGTLPDQNVVRKAFKTWKALGIGISFREVNTADDAMVRIGFDHTDGSWSAVGRDILTISKDQKTMNFGWDLSADSYGMTTAIHEIGHTIGFEHEHQSPFSGIEWNTAAVYKEFSGPPNNWKKNEIDSNIIEKIPRDQVLGSAWDAKSIMEYQFGPGLIVKPESYQNGVFPPGVISKNDKTGVKAFYPPVSKSSYVPLALNKSVPIKAGSGKQVDFIFKAPTTRKYTFQTVGELDTVMVISELVNSKKEYLSGDDDSGTNKNSRIKLPLVKGRSYVINIRVLYTAGTGESSIIVSAS
ncbi:hypothetical protein A3860_13670 [Niastella vici]|uniref:Peptidase metallopeptidase domain-containing protein n=1 Tax=Niastella vici TaxID=1703345 RepID=A0A1V9G7S0_9BACT|nr:M12 family metallopeptidase [Niastella vici]OQP66528.1 hypothetical protein A3860_13670 [Niastella vici]